LCAIILPSVHPYHEVLALRTLGLVRLVMIVTFLPKRAGLLTPILDNYLSVRLGSQELG
jgi:hypothetical protein